jgi:hypothetical protein
MATYSLVHGAWHGGWAWNLVRRELEERGHVVQAPDLPIEDVGATVADYAACVEPADVVVGHSLGGLTIPLVEAGTRVYVCALLSGVEWEFAPGFGGARVRDELGRSYYPRSDDAARDLQYPPEHAGLARLLRRQAPLSSDAPTPRDGVYVVCARDACVAPDWQRRVASGFDATDVLDAGHSPMLTHPRALAEILCAV